MKKTLLIASLGLLSMNLQAQTSELQEWTAKITGVTSAEDLYLQAPVCVDNAGSTYTTGQFTEAITIGSTTLEPVANSAYLAKYNADGTAAWAIGLSGAATITSVTTDESNNVYIAGTFADVVTVGSTDGKAQEIKGLEGAIKSASFIAAYNAKGELQAVRTFQSQVCEEVANNTDIFYIPDAGDPSFSINHIEASNGKVYVSARHTGDVQIDDLKWNGMYMIVDGFMYIDLQSAGIFTLNATDLKNATSIARIEVTEQFGATKMGFEDLNFTVDNGTVYLCFVANGKIKYNAADKAETIELANENGSQEHAFIVSSIKNQNVNTKIFHSASHNKLASYNAVNAMKVEGQQLYIGGTFFQQLAFDNSISHVGGSDLFVTALDKDSFEPTWTKASGLEEGDANYFTENFNTMTVKDGTVSVYGYILQDQDNEKKITSPLEFKFINRGVINENATVLITGADRKGETSALRSIDTESHEATLSVSAPTTGIQNVPALETQRVGNTFFFDQATDVQVYDLQGRLLKQAQKVTSVNIDNLQQGIYVLSNGKASVKVQK